MNPFDNEDRLKFSSSSSSSQQQRMRPRSWFILSVLGYFMQREMKPLVLHILSFVGGDAKVCRRRRRPLSTTTKKHERNKKRTKT
mmetsp:Transcript_5609/g.8517  ORF Transcript_5609/g.8517 Transcript_5609/m.8517 type:complete len:85 (+) Transcript_5609:152-406(+)